MIPMKQLLLICAVVALVGCWKKSIEEKFLTGELTIAEANKVSQMDLQGSQLTSVKGLEKLTQLEFLGLKGNPDLTQARIDQLQLHKALPKCWFD